MKVETIEYVVEATVNTGDFQNIRPGFRVVVSLDEGENPNQVKDKLVNRVDGWLEKEINKIAEDNK